MPDSSSTTTSIVPSNRRPATLASTRTGVQQPTLNRSPKSDADGDDIDRPPVSPRGAGRCRGKQRQGQKSSRSCRTVGEAWRRSHSRLVGSSRPSIAVRTRTLRRAGRLVCSRNRRLMASRRGRSGRGSPRTRGSPRPYLDRAPPRRGQRPGCWPGSRARQGRRPSPAQAPRGCPTSEGRGQLADLLDQPEEGRRVSARCILVPVQVPRGSASGMSGDRQPARRWIAPCRVDSVTLDRNEIVDKPPGPERLSPSRSNRLADGPRAASSARRTDRPARNDA